MTANCSPTASDACSLRAYTSSLRRPYSGPALGNHKPDSREDLTPRPRTHAPLLSLRASKDTSPGSGRRDLSQTCLSTPNQDHPPLVPDRAHLGFFRGIPRNDPPELPLRSP